MYLKPKESGKRGILEGQNQNARIVNPPRFAQLGGLTSPAKGMKKNTMRVRKPGGTAA